ncbi:unnamed protein product [Rhizopus stolonifer]
MKLFIGNKKLFRFRDQGINHFSRFDYKFNFFFFSFSTILMSSSVEQLPVQPLLRKNRSLASFDKTSFPDITNNQKYLAKQLLRFVELEDVYFDEETNVFIKKLIDFLQPTTMSPLSWVNFADINSAEMKQVMNQASRYFETRTEDNNEPSRHLETEVRSTNTAQQEKINERSRSLRDLFFNKQILFCREDSRAAHVLYILAAFASLLCQQPDLINNLVFIIICSSQVPSHELEAVPEIVRQINQLYGTTGFVPVHFYHQEIDQDELLAFMNAAHIGLCLTESSTQEFSLHTGHPRKSVFVPEPSNISRLTEALQNALMNLVK